MIPGLNIGYARTDGLDDTRPFVTKDRWHRPRKRAINRVQIRVADARRHQSNRDLAGTWLAELDLFDDQRGINFVENCGACHVAEGNARRRQQQL
jgi:hypothetical protein